MFFGWGTVTGVGALPIVVEIVADAAVVTVAEMR